MLGGDCSILLGGTLALRPLDRLRHRCIWDPAAERAASAAGARGSESWVAAQQALSALVAARGPVTRALADVDALAAATLARLGGISAGDKSAIETAAEAIAADLNVKPEEVVEMETRLSGGDVALEPQSDDGEESYAPIAYLADDSTEPRSMASSVVRRNTRKPAVTSSASKPDGTHS